jgi:hypothetical protein
VDISKVLLQSTSENFGYLLKDYRKEIAPILTSSILTSSKRHIADSHIIELILRRYVNYRISVMSFSAIYISTKSILTYGNLTTAIDSCISYVSTTATLSNNSLSGLICSILLMSLSYKQCVHDRNKRAIHTKAATDHTV